MKPVKFPLNLEMKKVLLPQRFIQNDGYRVREV